MKKSGVSFKEVYDYCTTGNMKELAQRCPLHEVLNDMVIRHLPNPLVSQKRRVPVIWHGDADSKIGMQMTGCDPDGDVALMVTKITRDPHAGEIATGRLFSGTLRRGQELYISGVSSPDRIQQVGVFMGPERLEVEKIPAGNIAAVTGLKNAIVGSTAASLREMTPFEVILHASEPVVTVAVEAKHMRDLPKLIEVLRQVSRSPHPSRSWCTGRP
jgi:elongation factor 2